MVHVQFTHDARKPTGKMCVLLCEPGVSGARRPSLWIVKAPILKEQSSSHEGTWHFAKLDEG